MGYSTDSSGRLCCDSCGVSGGVRKIRCPWNYCPRIALCKNCKTKHADKLGKKHHRDRGCEKSHNEFAADEALKSQNHAAGKFTLQSAIGLNDGTGNIRVSFIRQFMVSETKSGYETRDYIIHKSIYDKRDTFSTTHPTVEMFQTLGECKLVDDKTNNSPSTIKGV